TIPLVYFSWNSIHLNTHLVMLLFGAGIAEFCSIYTFVKMHSFAHLSISTIISRTLLIWVPILALLFLQEKIVISEYLGIGVIFFGLSLASSPKKIFLDRGLKFAYLFAFVTAVNVIFQK